MDKVSSRKLAADCRMVIGDAKEVFKAWAGQTRQRIMQRRRQHEEVPEKAALAAGESLQERWAPVALAAGAGMIVGLIIRPMVKRMG